VPLRKIGIDPGTFDSAEPELIRFVMASFDLSPDLQRQHHGGGRHFRSDQFADCFVDGPTCDRLTVGFTARSVSHQNRAGKSNHFPHGLPPPARLELSRSTTFSM
jgi:hypothetical protein